MKKDTILDLYASTYKEDNYPPVAGKIMGLFFISNQQYFTFEEIMEAVNASKSATSKAIKLLLSFNEINFVTLKEHKRRRHFYLDVEGNVKHIQRVVDAYYMQTELLKHTLTLRDNNNKKLNRFIETSIDFNTDVLNYIEEKIKEYYHFTLNNTIDSVK